ncbi:4'-phosphopantetheinyl transferase family protein [Candidatus Tisiphia endosymbiont of Ceraclea dissimilis]|uniref:4'-phosphopantetheinyl transferase family protein n=1 Tax=Candidatus Tisiphia endosymbiont of Ceraclea dissimilis TaxID=3077928 RepID=UPI003CCAA01F
MISIIDNFKKSVDCWNIEIDNNIYLCSLSHINILSEKEKCKFYSFKKEEDKKRFLISHIALRSIINSYTQTPLDLINFRYNEYGKMYLDCNNLNLYFNLSHSKGKSLIVFSDNEIGVDLEYVDKFTNINEIVDFTFSESERILLQESDIRQRYAVFYDIWTKKEAYLKALSTGLVDNLYEICTEKIKSNFKKIKLNKYIANIATKDKIKTVYIKQYKI